jgi:hypothetical protein
MSDPGESNYYCNASEWTRSMYASSEWGSLGAEPTANETGTGRAGRVVAGASATTSMLRWDVRPSE